MVDLKITYQVEGGSETTVGEWSTGLMSWQFVEQTMNVAAPEGKNVLLSLQSQGCRMAHRSADEAQNQVRLSMLEELAKVQKVRIDPIAGDDEVITGFRLMLPTERPRTVLVVDDNEDALQLLQRYLSQHGQNGCRSDRVSEEVTTICHHPGPDDARSGWVGRFTDFGQPT